MKPLPLLTVASIVLNVALVSLLVAGFEHSGAPSLGSAPPTKTSSGPQRAKIDPTIWPGIRTTELPALGARLRAAGFPPEMIRVVISEQLREASAPQRRGLEFAAESEPFWGVYWPDLRRVHALRRLDEAHDTAVSDLLGEEPAEKYDPRNDLFEQRLLKSVPPEKRGQVQKLFREVDAKQDTLLEETSRFKNRGQSDAIHQNVDALERDRRAALVQILTPTEFVEYELRMSDTAEAMREGLAAFNPTEAEFRQIFQLQRAFDQRHAEFLKKYTVDQAPEETSAVDQAQKQLITDIKATLGPDRGEEYVRATDSDYKRTSKLVTRLGLQSDAAIEVWRVQQLVQQRLEAINTEGTLAEEDRLQQVAALAAEAKSKISAALGGEHGLQAYEEYNGGWIRILQMRKKKSNPARP